MARCRADGHPPLIAIADLARCGFRRGPDRGANPVGGHDLLALPHAVLFDHLAKAGIVTGAQVQAAQHKGHADAVGHIIGGGLDAQRRDDLVGQQGRDVAPRGTANHHPQHMRVDRRVLHLRPGCGEGFGQAGGKVVHFSAQSQHAAHAVDVAVIVQIILVEGHARGHLQHVADGRPVIGTARQPRRVFGNRIVQRGDGAVGDQYAHQGG